MMKTGWLAYGLLILFLSVYTTRAQSLFINEMQSSNDITLLDEDDESSDWLEIYNAGGTARNLEGYSLTDDEDRPRRWIFPAVSIPAGGFELIFASGKDRYERPLHTNFSLKAAGEPLFLFDPDGELVDSFPEIPIPRDISLGRFPDGTGAPRLMDTPTPGLPNLEPIDTAIPVSLIFSHETGFYPEAFSLDITATQTGVKIRYTLDGSVPTDSSPVFEPALIEDQLERYPALAFQIHEPWQAPRHPVPQATVIRAQAFDDQGPRGPLFTRTYWVGEDQANAHNLPVVSLVMEPASLMGYDSGIYVPGATFDRFGWENFIQVGPEWERGADISWLEKNGKVGLQQSIGIRVHGRGSRFGAQKSFRLYARDQYGKARLDYPFFSKNQVQSFKRLLLRTPMADWTRGGLRDMAAHAIIRDMNLEWMDMQPVALYMNGEYWGMYNLRERLDEFYLASHYNLDPDSINIVENDGQIVEGSVRGYRSLLSKLIAGPVPLDSLAQWVDVDAFLDYQIAQHFFANVDWPGTNFRYWQPQTDSRKWRWFFFDLDAGWFYTDLNPVET
ncbi:MAG: CotH kinase family protein, partial [Bacteroidota bacterium]